MENKEIEKEDISEITKETFKEAIYLAYRDGITSKAPLGFSGDTIIIHGDKNETTSRVSQVSVRNYCGDAELLITDQVGNFLFYGRFRIDLGVEYVVEQYWNIFNLVKDSIKDIVIRKSSFKNIQIPDNCPITEGFKILELAQKGLLHTT